jgi:hypothetical protein
MGPPRLKFDAYTPLPRAFRAASLAQADVANYFAEANCDFEDDPPSHHYVYVARTRKWHVAHDTYCTQWRHPEWSVADEHDPLPQLYARVIKIIRRLTEQSSDAERRRCLSHSFIAGTIRLLQHDPRMVAEPWEVAPLCAPRPIREQLAAERDAERYAAMQSAYQEKRNAQ